MTPKPKTSSALTPAEQWDAMTDEQKVEWLAAFMGWEKRYMQTLDEMSWSEKEMIAGKEFWSSRLLEKYEGKLLDDWNLWRQVEEKVMGDWTLLHKYNSELDTWVRHEVGDDNYEWIGRLMKATLPTRAKALFLAMNAL